MASKPYFPVPDKLPTPQAQNHPTFKPQPLDGTILVPELFGWNAENNPDHPLFVFADGPQGETRTIKYPEAFRIIKRAAKIAKGYYKRYESVYEGKGLLRAQTGPVLGILANADTISYWATMASIMCLGLVPFPISPRNSAIAVAHLVKSVGVMQMLVSPDPAMQRLCSEAQAILKKDGIELEVLPMIQYEQISDEGAGTPEDEEIVFTKLDIERTVCVYHSSGSTSFPKPIYIKNRTLLQWTMAHAYGERDLCGTVLAVHTAPLFHSMGCVNFIWTVVTGMIMACFKPTSPPAIPTPESYLEGIIRTKSEMAFCVPSFVEAWMRDPANYPAIKKLKAILYAGGPIDKAVGDQVTGMGVPLYPFYGATEVGSISTSIPAGLPTVDTWQWFHISRQLTVELLPQEESDDLFEVCIVRTEYFQPNVTNSTSSDGRPMYRTSDLLQRHPTEPTLYRVYGRADDQIMLSTGEKTNPGPLESILMQDPHVASAVIFGRGQFQNGVLVDPKPQFAFDPTDEVKLAEFRNLIWPTVEKLNNFAPAHSRLFKETILVSKPSKPFELTSKMTARRHVVIKAYAEEIETLYETIKNSSQEDIPPRDSWSAESTKKFIRKVVERVMQLELDDNSDFFLEGCDSLQATYIRNSIIHALWKSSDIPTARLPNNFVYSNPTIASLSSFILSFLASDSASSHSIEEAKILAMQSMLETYASSFPSHSARGTAPAASVDEIVLLTGTTGRLGAHLLAQLLEKKSVARVYALNRAGVGNIEERQRATFDSWGLDVGLLRGDKVKLVEADFSKKDLGVGEGLFAEMRDSVTSIIHNAWRVDFNLSLSSFEPLVAGVRNLVELSLSSPRPSPPPVLFTSSISVLIHSPSSPVPELPVTDPKIAVANGYSEGKWVAESILLRAAKESGIKVNIVRVGQLCGDSKVGGWNEKEWLPVMLRGSQVLGATPHRVEDISFVPVDIAASALLDMLGSDEPVLHLVHPYTVSWDVISHTAAEVLGVPIIPYKEWVSRLHTAAQSANGEAARHNPAIKLLEFFERDMGESSDGIISTDKAVQVSPSLKGLTKLDRKDVELWMAYWKKVGLLQ
nr:carboxylic acid reductase [Boreostereum vibrans]